MAAHEAASGITQFHALSSEWQATDHRVPIGKALLQVDRGCNAQQLQIELPADDLRRSCCARHFLAPRFMHGKQRCRSEAYHRRERNA